MVTVEKLTRITPTTRQLNWQKLDFYGFIHFGMNTMTDKEWGDGTDDPSLFNPEKLDCDQWIKGLKEAGMKGAILTCKHHDGFCLWPSQYSNYTIAASPYKNGSGDIVLECAKACKKYDLKFGVYLSPWDRADIRYGTGLPYDDYYVAQLTELLTQYGDIFEVWFDGANGEKEGKKQTYDWERYYATVRKYQPNAVMAVCGPDVRWIGNEAGVTRKEEWSVVPISLRDAEKTAEKSQKEDNGNFGKELSSSEEDLGSFTKLADYKGEVIWYPAEVNTSIRPGWFYHEDEDQKVKSPEELIQVYKNSVGGNASFLLNVPPNKDGLIAKEDRAVLKAVGEYLKEYCQENLAAASYMQLSSNLIANEKDTKLSFTSVGEKAPLSFVFLWDEGVEVNTVVLQEDIFYGQQIEKLTLSGLTEELRTVSLGEFFSVGNRRIIEFPTLKLKELHLEISEYRGEVHLADIFVGKNK